jgi:hypothetical protein
MVPHRFVNIHLPRMSPVILLRDGIESLHNQDGNGRVTRALVLAILVRFGLLPFLVTVEDKDDYFRALMAVSFHNISHCPH